VVSQWRRRQGPGAAGATGFGFGLLQLDKAVEMAVTEHPLPPTSTPQKKSRHENGPTERPSSPEVLAGERFPPPSYNYYSGAIAPCAQLALPYCDDDGDRYATATCTPPQLHLHPYRDSTATPTQLLHPAQRWRETCLPQQHELPMPAMPWVAGFLAAHGADRLRFGAEAK